MDHAAPTPPPVQTTLTLAGPEATEALAAAIAPHLAAGDFLGLHGGLGAGKSAFARALITARLAALGRAEDIPSPSFTLVQVYDLGSVELWHADLYRLGSTDELVELGLDEAFASADRPRRMGRAPRRRRRPPAASTSPSPSSPGADDARTATLTAQGPGWDWLAPVLGAFA